jgi:hypothetical protein
MYELCCDMIDLLINMSEIYGQPNGNSIRSIEDDNDEREDINGESSEWNTGIDDDENNEPVMNGDHTYLHRKNLKISFKKNYFVFLIY